MTRTLPTKVPFFESRSRTRSASPRDELAVHARDGAVAEHEVGVGARADAQPPFELALEPLVGAAQDGEPAAPHARVATRQRRRAHGLIYTPIVVPTRQIPAHGPPRHGRHGGSVARPAPRRARGADGGRQAGAAGTRARSGVRAQPAHRGARAHAAAPRRDRAPARARGDRGAARARARARRRLRRAHAGQVAGDDAAASGIRRLRRGRGVPRARARASLRRRRRRRARHPASRRQPVERDGHARRRGQARRLRHRQGAVRRHRRADALALDQGQAVVHGAGAARGRAARLRRRRVLRGRPVARASDRAAAVHHRQSAGDVARARGARGGAVDGQPGGAGGARRHLPACAGAGAGGALRRRAGDGGGAGADRERARLRARRARAR